MCDLAHDTAMKNTITDVPGLRVGQTHDSRVATGVTALVFDEPAVASIATLGGAPGLRDTGLLEPEMTVGAVDAILLSGGSAFGLDAAGGAMAAFTGAMPAMTRDHSSNIRLPITRWPAEL